ncbi:MAG TPA: autotransporter-associated beta strand repeat-containing protein, partial [Rariglobus sp.]
NGNSFLAISGSRTFSGGLEINGGRLTLSGTGNHTGGTTLNNGRLILGSDGALGANSGTLTLNGGILTYSGTAAGQTRTVSNAIVIGGDITLLDSQNIQSSATLALTGTVDLNGGNRTLVLDRTGTPDKSSQPPVVMSGVVSNGGIIKTGTASLLLSNAASTYSGTTVVRQGTLIVGANAGNGVNGALGNATSAIELGDSGSSSLNATVQRIQLLTNGAFTVDRAVNVNSDNSSGTTVIGGSNATGTATYSNTITLNRGVILAANTGGITRFSGAINDGAGSHGVTIGNYTFGAVNTGGGVIVLSNATGNTYDGGTTVTTGALIVNNTSGSGTGTGAVSVGTGATFGGSGIVSGATTAAAGSFLSPGSDSGVTGNLTFGSSLDLTGLASGAGGLLFNLDTTAASDKITLSAGALSIGTGTLNFDDFAFTTLAGFGEGTYTLLDTSTSIVGSLGSSLTGTLGGLNAALSFANGGQDIILTVTSSIPEPSTYAALLGALALAGATFRRRNVASR